LAPFDVGHMAAALPLRAALVRGGLVTLANWPIILIDFAVESLFKLALSVPVVGGAFMVAVLVGADIQALFAEGVRSAAELVISALINAPVALMSFLAAIGLVAIGGSLVMFLIKAGTLSILVAGERQAGEIQETPLRLEALTETYAYNLAALLGGIRQFGRRALRLSLWLSGAYAVVAFGYVEALGAAFRLAARPAWGSVWPLVVVLATSIGAVTITVANLAFDLMRIIVICDDCGVRAAAARLWSFLIEDARQVVGIFAVVGVLVALATAASILVAGGLALVAWVPVVGLIVVPLQAAAWLVRGLLFQYMGLSALAAYQAQYRRFSSTAGARAVSVSV
jgi:hypothetical protein